MTNLSEPSVFRVTDPSLRRDWTTTEVQILREHYPAGGAFVCAPLLPARTLSSIYQAARKAGLHSPKYTPTGRRYAVTEPIDAEIRRVYSQAPTRRCVQELAARMMRPRWWVSKRAAALGLVTPRFKEPPWSAAELALLTLHAHKHPEVIRRALLRAGHRRTTTAIALQIKRRGIEHRDPDHCTANALARLMGVDAKTVTRWIEAEGLPATRRGTARVAVQGGDQWWIHRTKLRAWIGTHAQLVDLRKVERYWFLDLVFHS